MASQAKLDKFAQLRQRALDQGAAPTKVDDLVLDEEYGFTPPVVVRLPQKASQLEDFDKAYREKNIFGILKTVLGPIDYSRVIRVFDNEPDSLELLTGLGVVITEHFYSMGAEEVGGSRP